MKRKKLIMKAKTIVKKRTCIKGLVLKAGCPSKFPSIDIEKMCRLMEVGATDEQIGIALNIGVKSVYTYKKRLRFLRPVEEAEKIGISKIKKALFRRALGYTHQEIKVFCNAFGKVTKVRVFKHYPPEVNAANLWLRNRDKDWDCSTNAPVFNNTNVNSVVTNTIKPGEVCPEHRERVLDNIEILKRNGLLTHDTNKN